MGSAPPLPTEFHRLVIVLDGKKLKGSKKQRAAMYDEYLDEMLKLARKHGAVRDWTDYYLKNSEITKRKKGGRRRARTPAKRGRN